MEILSQSISGVVDRQEWPAVKVTWGGPKLSHIFFVDDLLLFSEAYFSQVRLMEHVLAQFFGFSGQKVNRSKS